MKTHAHLPSLPRIAALTALLSWGLSTPPSPVLGEEHAAHPATSVATDTIHLGTEFRILKVMPAPQGFGGGHLTFDPVSERLFLLSFGPPANTQGPSVLYELAPQDGRVLRRAQMPFAGEFGTPSLVDGVLYQIIDHQSRLYKISVAAETFGQIVNEIALPTLKDLELREQEPLRFPWISFRGLTKTPQDQLLAHAQDLGELVTLDPHSGQILRRVPTLRALSGIAAIPGPQGELWVLANSDPVKANFEYHVRRYMFRSEPGMVPPVRYGKRAIHWILLDAASGEVLASLRQLEPRVEAASVAWIARHDLPGARYGRFTFFGIGPEGIFTLEWTPGKPS